jgi:hypothetical protein
MRNGKVAHKRSRVSWMLTILASSGLLPLAGSSPACAQIHFAHKCGYAQPQLCTRRIVRTALMCSGNVFSSSPPTTGPMLVRNRRPVHRSRISDESFRGVAVSAVPRCPRLTLRIRIQHRTPNRRCNAARREPTKSFVVVVAVLMNLTQRVDEECERFSGMNWVELLRLSCQSKFLACPMPASSLAAPSRKGQRFRFVVGRVKPSVKSRWEKLQYAQALTR